VPPIDLQDLRQVVVIRHSFAQIVRCL
jgi:hypothetical protein